MTTNMNYPQERIEEKFKYESVSVADLAARNPQLKKKSVARGKHFSTFTSNYVACNGPTTQ